MADIDIGMPKPDLKKIVLACSGDSPAKCAVGLHRTAGFAYVQVAKTGEAAALAAKMKKEFGITAVSHGTALVGARDAGPGLTPDQAGDTKLLVFRLEKPVPGIAKRLKKSLKGTGFAKVMVIYPGGETDADLEAEEGDEAAAHGDAAAAQPAQPEATTAAPLAEPQAAPPQAPVQDAAALSKRLATLIPKVAAAAPALKAELSPLAANANQQLKAGNLNAAAVFIDELAAKLGQPAPHGDEGAAATADKTKQIWLKTRAKLETDLDTLHAEISATYKDSQALPEIDSSFRSTVAPVLTNLDTTLADNLDALAQQTDPAQRAPLIAATQATIKRYQDYVATQLVTDLDDNPFVKLGMRETVTKMLAAISAAVH